MQQTLHYDFVGGHILVEHGLHRLLLDTGAPSSIGTLPTVALADRRHPLGSEYGGVTAKSMCAQIGVETHAILGGDILNNYDIVIDPEICDITFSDAHFDIEGEVLELGLRGEIPFVTASVHGTRVKMFFDTGAPLSYLSRDMNRQHVPVRIVEDFHPRAGTSRVATYQVSITLGQDTLEYRVGTMPFSLQRALRAVDIEGILGTALLRYFIVCFSPRRRKLILKKRSARTGALSAHGAVDKAAHG